MSNFGVPLRITGNIHHRFVIKSKGKIHFLLFSKKTTRLRTMFKLLKCTKLSQQSQTPQQKTAEGSFEQYLQ